MRDAPSWKVLEQDFQAVTKIPGGTSDASGWWARWHRHIADRSSPRWFYTPENAPAWFECHWPALRRRWIQSAESLLDDLVHAGEFRPERLSNGDIDWGANPTKSMSFAGLHYWSWANPLIRAYGLTQDERFPVEVSGHLRSYAEQLDTFTPELWTGVEPGRRDWRDWVTYNDLSAGIKMATLAEAVMVFRRASSWSAADLRRATLILVRLASRLYDTYKDVDDEDEFLRTRNFLTSGAVGLGVVACIFPECAWAERWKALAIRILDVHLARLFYDDGGHRELCTQYHKAGIRDILFFEQVLAARGEGHFLVDESCRSLLRNILLWLSRILMPDGTTAVLNSAAASNDWLVFFIVANRKLGDSELAWHIHRRYRPHYLPRQKAIPALCARLIGEYDGYVPLQPVSKPCSCSALLPDSGIAVLRDGWDRWANTMVLDFGRPLGGHAYPARGSFSLYLRGRPAAMSPGSPHAYTDPDYQEWMHTTLSQNTVMIDDLNQEEWQRPGGDRITGEILCWNVDTDSALVQGRHEGYLPNTGIVHIRTVKLLYGRFFLIHDILDATKAGEDHVAKWSIHCPGELCEMDGRAVLADGLMCIVPAWPERVTTIEFGARGKAVWPADSEDGCTDVHRRLYHARWHAPVKAGSTQQFLMFAGPDDGPVSIGRTCVEKEQMIVEVSWRGVTDTVRIPVIR